MGPELEAILNILAARFGTTLEHLMEIAVRQAYVTGFRGIILGGMAVIFGLVTVVFGLRWKKNEVDEFYLVPLFFCVVLAISAGFGAIADNVPRFLNPEFYALQVIAEFIKTGGR